MPEPVDAERSLEERLARAVGAVPGVARLEPSLAHAIRGLARLGRSASTEEADSPDGVSATRREDAVDVAVEISVTGPGTALETAVAVREAVRAELALASLGVGAVNVRVLSVDSATGGHDHAVDAASDGDREVERATGGQPSPLTGADGLFPPDKPGS